jgi:hypothetical protein
VNGSASSLHLHKLSVLDLDEALLRNLLLDKDLAFLATFRDTRGYVLWIAKLGMERSGA